ncbi:MAG: hypothetical protein ACXV74_13220 [Methylobacter sp.]
MRFEGLEGLLAEMLAEDPLRDFFTWWDEVYDEDLDALKATLDGAKKEEDVQQFLQLNPKLIIQHLGGGGGRYVIPKARLGAEYVTDFLIAERHSFGFEWQAVELESPLRPCNGQLKQDTFLSSLPIEFPLKFQRGLIA